MPAGGKIGNKGGTGNPGYGALKLIRDNVKKHCPEWWEAWQKDMKGNWEHRKVAMQEFNKLQVKLMPTVVAGDDENPLILQFDESFNITSKTKRDNSKPEKV